MHDLFYEIRSASWTIIDNDRMCVGKVKADYWYVTYHEVIRDEAIVDHGKTHINASDDPPHFSTLRDLLQYAMHRRQLIRRRFNIEAITSLTLFGQRDVTLDDRPRANTVYHVYFRRRRQFTDAELCSDDEALKSETEE